MRHTAYEEPDEDEGADSFLTSHPRAIRGDIAFTMGASLTRTFVILLSIVLVAAGDLLLFYLMLFCLMFGFVDALCRREGSGLGRLLMLILGLLRHEVLRVVGSNSG